MKHRIIIGLLACLLPAAALAQEATEKWPYLFSEFENGVVRSQDGTLLEGRKLNICVSDGALHYVENGKILAARMTQVFSAKIEEDVFVRAAGKMMKVLIEGENVAVLEFKEVDVEKFNTTEIGYGIASKTASSTQVSNLASTAGVVNMNLYDVLATKQDGRELPLKRTLYLLVNGKLIVATKTSVLKQEGVDKAAANAFFKENKIKWHNPVSLLKVAEYLKQYE